MEAFQTTTNKNIVNRLPGLVKNYKNRPNARIPMGVFEIQKIADIKPLSIGKIAESIKKQKIFQNFLRKLLLRK